VSSRIEATFVPRAGERESVTAVASRQLWNQSKPRSITSSSVTMLSTVRATRGRFDRALSELDLSPVLFIGRPPLWHGQRLPNSLEVSVWRIRSVPRSDRSNRPYLLQAHPFPRSAPQTTPKSPPPPAHAHPSGGNLGPGSGR